MRQLIRGDEGRIGAKRWHWDGILQNSPLEWYVRALTKIILMGGNPYRPALFEYRCYNLSPPQPFPANLGLISSRPTAMAALSKRLCGAPKNCHSYLNSKVIVRRRIGRSSHKKVVEAARSRHVRHRPPLQKMRSARAGSSTGSATSKGSI